MERSPRFSVLLCVVFIAAVEAEMSGSGSEESGSGSPDQSDASLTFSTEALIGICVGGGVVLLTCVVFTCLCVVGCIWRRRRQKSRTLSDPELNPACTNGHSSSAHSTLSTVTHSLAGRLLSISSKGKKIPQISRDSDLTVGMTPSDNSNPLYNSSSIAYFPSRATPDHPNKLVETPLSADVLPVLSVSSRRHSLGYVEMQSAGSALAGITASRSVGDFAESVEYGSVKDRASYSIPLAPPSYTHSSPLTSSAPGLRHHHLHPLRLPPSPSSPSHPHTPSKEQTAAREEDRGGEDDYVDPKLFLDDQERILQEGVDAPNDDGYEDVREQLGLISTQKNRAHLDSLSASGNHVTSGPAHQPHPPNPSAQPSYQNVGPEEAYLSDSYEQVSEFLAHELDLDEKDALLSPPDDGERRKTRTAPSSPHRLPETAQSARATGNEAAQKGSPGMKESQSLDRKLSLDNQYVEVVSPARKAHSMKAPRSTGNTNRPDPASPELDYQNVVPGTETWGRGNTAGSSDDNLHAVEGQRLLGGQRSSPREPRQETRGKTPSPTPRARNSPKPQVKPKPHPSQLAPAKARSKSSDDVTQNSTQQLVVVGGQSTPQNRKKTHREEIGFPSHPVANGNAVAHGDVTVGNRDGRWRSATELAAAGGGDNERGEGEVLYVNVAETVGEELYENVTNHL